MYLSRNAVREFHSPRRLVIKRQASIISPTRRNDSNMDSISIISSDRSSTPQPKPVKYYFDHRSMLYARHRLVFRIHHR